MALTFAYSNESRRSWEFLLNVSAKKKSLPAGLSAGNRRKEGGGEWERNPLLQRNSECRGTLTQVFCWIRPALYRESMHTGTKNDRGGASDTCLDSDLVMVLKWLTSWQLHVSIDWYIQYMYIDLKAPTYRAVSRHSACLVCLGLKRQWYKEV